MATEDDPMSFELNPERPIPYTVRSPPSKPQGGARILSFLLQAVVMAIALSLFFLFAGVAALILLHLFVAGRALRRRRRLILHSLNPNPTLFNHQYQSSDPPALSPQNLKSLPSFNFSTSQAMTSTSSDCAICLEGLRDGDRCRRLPSCGHAYHRDCVDRWLMRSPVCPVCRRGVIVAVDG